MECSKIKYVDIPVSKIILGTAFPSALKGENNDELFDEAFRLGINTIDTARRYQNSEASIGRWLTKRNNRDKVVIISKGGHHDDLGNKRITPKDIRDDLEESLRLLNTSYIDIYLLHRDDESVDVSIIINLLNELHNEGKIKAFGVSNWSAKRIKEANKYALDNNLIPFTVNSPHYSLAEQVSDPWGGGCVTLTGNEHKEDRKYFEELNIPILCYSCLGRGMLSGKVKSSDYENIKSILDENAIIGYVSKDNFERLKRAEELSKKYNTTVSNIALAWLFNQPLNTFAICTMSKKERISENIKSLELKLTKEECDYLNLQKSQLD